LQISGDELPQIGSGRILEEIDERLERGGLAVMALELESHELA